jgi:excinuclease ABC subunit C
MNNRLKDKLKTLPATPGVYFHKSKTGEIIYVGKAAVLKNRVRQYFQSKKDFDLKTLALVNEIDDTDWLETESEIDALFLESEMVKRYMPRYNILLRDDKSQLFIRIDMKSEWPTVSFTRNPADDGADYYGPYYNGYAIKKALRYLRKVFPYYTKQPSEPRKADLDIHLGLSPALDMTSAQYKTNLRKLVQYIQGGRLKLVQEIERDMKAAAKAQEFEEAAKHRNRLNNLRELQHRIMFGDKEFLDISKDHALHELATLLCLEKVPARIEGYDISHMSGSNVVASMVVFSNGVSDRAAYRKFKMSNQRNDDTANIKEVITRRFKAANIKSWGIPDLLLIDGGKGQLSSAIEALAEYSLTIPVISIAKREEEIIISKTGSHIDTTQVVALRDAKQAGTYVYEEGGYFMVNLHADQLNASGHSKNLRGGSQTNAYSDVTKLFQRIRDESHRFAVSYHSVLKRQSQTKSALDDVPGVGPASRKKLLRAFGSVRGIASATEQEISNVVGASRARAVKAHLADS